MDRVDKNQLNHYKKVTFIQPLFKKGEYVKEVWEKCNYRCDGARVWKVHYESNATGTFKILNDYGVYRDMTLVDLCNNCIDKGIKVEFDG